MTERKGLAVWDEETGSYVTWPSAGDVDAELREARAHIVALNRTLNAAEQIVSTIQSGTVYESGEPSYYNGSIDKLYQAIAVFRAMTDLESGDAE